jgi:hypothetical protein
MEETLIRRAKHSPGWQDWSRRMAALEQTDTERLARILAVFIDPPELSEAVGAVKAAGFHR